MNKYDLIEKISADTGLTKGEAERMLTSFVKVATAAMVKGENVKFVGFGTLMPRKYKARNGRNPKTGVTIRIPAHRGVHFRVGLELKTKLNKQKG